MRPLVATRKTSAAKKSLSGTENGRKADVDDILPRTVPIPTNLPPDQK